MDEEKRGESYERVGVGRGIRHTLRSNSPSQGARGRTVKEKEEAPWKQKKVKGHKNPGKRAKKRNPYVKATLRGWTIQGSRRGEGVEKGGKLPN